MQKFQDENLKNRFLSLQKGKLKAQRALAYPLQNTWLYIEGEKVDAAARAAFRVRLIRFSCSREQQIYTADENPLEKPLLLPQLSSYTHIRTQYNERETCPRDEKSTQRKEKKKKKKSTRRH